MAIFTLNWTPAGGVNSLSQSVKHREKGTGTWLTTNTAPANPVGSAVATADVSTLDNNTIYDFQVDNICEFGGPTSSPVLEQIVYACAGSVLVIENADQTATISISGINLLSLNVAKFFVYDSTNTTLLETSANIAVAPSTSWTTAALADGDYYIRVQYGAIVNGIQELSAFGPTTCRYSFTIT